MSFTVALLLLLGSRVNAADVLWPDVAAPALSSTTNALPSTPALTSTASNLPASSTNAATTNLAPAGVTNRMDALDDKHKLAIGDRLSFRIIEDEEDPKPLFVTDSGDLEVPYIGRVPAESKTCRELATEIKTALEKDYYFQATVILAVDVMTRSSHGRVYLVGAVRNPGPVEIPGDEVLTLSRAILRAGGFLDFANKRAVKLTRKGATGKDDKRSFTVDVGEIFDKGNIEADLTLEPGDLIFVPDRLIRF